MDADAKKQYDEKAAADKARYKEQITEFKAKEKSNAAAAAAAQGSVSASSDSDSD